MAVAREALAGARELHGEQGALDLEDRRALETTREAHHLQPRDEPLGRIPLPPAHAVAVVVREDVVEVVIALAVGDDRDDRVVARGVLVGVRPAAPHVGERVDEEGDVMAPHEAQHAREDQHAPNVVRENPEQERQADVEGDRERHVVAVLEGQHGIALEVRDVGEVGPAARVLAQHPADVREPEAAPRRVRVAIHVVDVQVMGAVTAAPGEHAVLQCHGAEEEIQQPQAPVRVVGAMRPQPVVAGRDRHAVRAGEQHACGPGRGRKAVRQPIPGDQDERAGEAQREHQHVGPDQGGRTLRCRGRGEGLLVARGVGHALPEGVERMG